VRFNRRRPDRLLGLLAADSICEEHRRAQRNEDGNGSHPVIIDLSHLDAFDSWGTFRVALRPQPFVPGGNGDRPELHFVYFVYSFLTGLAAVLLLPYWIVQGLRRKKYLSNVGERLGFSFPSLRKLPLNHPGAIWIHAVSVGEVLAGVSLARRLQEVYPSRPLVVSTTTITGQALARERMPFADAIFYFPLDWAFSVRRALRAVRPSLVVILETEIWPNFLREARRSGIPVLFVSGRISDRSFARYESYLGVFGFFLRPFLRHALSCVTTFLAQSEKDAVRIRALGAAVDRVQVSGNLKYDLELPESTPIADWLEAEAQRRGRTPIIVAGSIVASEEPLALIAFGTLQGEHPHALLVLAPRKPERFEEAAEFIDESHRKYLRRSQLQVSAASKVASQNGEPVIPDDVTVLLLDSIGELGSLYRLADGALVGGSLVPSGGHNILEPAAFGKIPVFGPHMENFAEIAARFVAAGAAIQVESPEDAGVAWIELLRNPERMRKMGEAARGLIAGSRGATDRAVAEIAKHLPNASSEK
jgi:3-deoxy-D-manno-octulosonic-acid transferase